MPSTRGCADPMPLSQVQIIQSLGEALHWFERELGWGTSPAELNHLTGRIGELYAAMITRGQMASSVNQQGYDVVSADGERLSVKTITTSQHMTFNQRTLELVDRILVLRIRIDEGEVSIEELLDATTEEASVYLREYNGKLRLPVTSLLRDVRPKREPKAQSAIEVDGYTITVLESGSILVASGAKQINPAKPVLRILATDYGVDLLNGTGNPKNTRQLGTDLVRAVNEMRT
mmetsp:Transcript_4408/g.7960  ORF Transcript_4408/g.7960 Transcript_4408/m.7960 type:complete len:233 (+) Transcript_4408:78-776(+)